MSKRKSNANKPFMCGSCHKLFVSQEAAEEHARDVHHKARTRIFKAVSVVSSASASEPSMADLMVQAEINRSMGVRNEDWIEEMLP